MGHRYLDDRWDQADLESRLTIANQGLLGAGLRSHEQDGLQEGTSATTDPTSR